MLTSLFKDIQAKLLFDFIEKVKMKETFFHVVLVILIIYLPNSAD